MLQELLFRNHTYVRQQGPLFLLSVIVGIVGGLGAIAFRLLIGGNQHLFFGKILSVVSLHVGSLNLGIILLPAPGGLIVGLLVDRFAPEAKGHGVPEVIEAVHFRGGVIRPVVAAVKILVSSVTIGSGGSAGREGPIAQIGAGFGSFLANRLRLPERDRRILLAAGVGAGVGSIFRAPLAGALFAAEILYSDPEFESDAVIPAALSTIVAYCVFSIPFGFESLFSTPPFTFRSPLHDGAAIIAEGRIKAASFYLPLTMNPSLSRTYGTRHRAAFGITEESDAVAVVVSEERGVVSLVDGGEAKEELDAKGLQEALRVALSGGPLETGHGIDRKHAVTTGPSDA